MSNNRTKIKKFLNDLNLSFEHLDYSTRKDYTDHNSIYGVWCLWLTDGNYYETDQDTNVDFAVEKMLNEIKEDYL
jgi:hypothetical protein